MCIVDTPTSRARKAPAVGTLQAGLALRTLRKNSSRRQKDSFPGKKKIKKMIGEGFEPSPPKRLVP